MNIILYATEFVTDPWSIGFPSVQAGAMSFAFMTVPFGSLEPERSSPSEEHVEVNIFTCVTGVQVINFIVTKFSSGERDGMYETSDVLLHRNSTTYCACVAL